LGLVALAAELPKLRSHEGLCPEPYKITKLWLLFENIQHDNPKRKELRNLAR
jgi:hypothetical protein